MLSLMQALGLEIDDQRNEATVGRDGSIGAEGSIIEILVLCTDEEKSIAQQTMQVLQNMDQK